MDIKNLSEETKRELLNLIIQDINIDGVTESLYFFVRVISEASIDTSYSVIES